MKKILKAFVSLLLVGTSLNTLAQDVPIFDKMVDFLPPAPNAASIIKYNEASVNKNTGAANVSIPLYTVKGLKLSTTVSLGYSSGGLKVDELSGRVGMGWAINAGGVVTRTVRGLVDELNTRHYPYAPITLNHATHQYMKRISSATPVGDYDAEPDLFSFSFDGYSGQFVLDAGMNPVLVNKSGLKIEKNFSGTDWNFKITTPDGIAYLFGGTGAVEQTKRDHTCGKTFSSYVPTAWYLKEIQHLNGEKIQFSYTPLTYAYDNGVSQSMSNPGTFGVGSGCTCNYIAPTSCVNIARTSGVLLQSVTSPGLSEVTFSYATRADCDDKLISTVTLKERGTVAGLFTLTYNTVTSNSAYNNDAVEGFNKTPYLVKIEESVTGNSDVRTHYFSYLDPANRPARLSYSQDHWGYFNGKVNTTLLPDLGINYSDLFPNATAKREPDFSYAQKGLLQKVVYPTGGVTMLFYEPHTFGDPGTEYSTLHKLSCDVTGTGTWDVASKSMNFHIAGTEKVKLKIFCRVNDSQTAPFNHHNVANVDVINLADNSVVFHGNYHPTDDLTETIYFTSAGDYQLKIDAAGTMLTCLTELKYHTAISTSAYGGKQMGGARVAKITTGNPGETPLVKKYYYANIDNLSHSSLNWVANPVYIGMNTGGAVCSPSSNTFICAYTQISSSSLYSMGLFNGATVSYASVVEGIGNNFEGGATETRFASNMDGGGTAVWGKDILNAARNNFASAYLNGKQLQETVFKKDGSGNLIPLNKTVYQYKIDAAGDGDVPGYAVYRYNEVYPAAVMDSTCDLSVNPGAPLSCLSFLMASLSNYNMVSYHVFSTWTYPEQEIQTVYDENGLNPITSTTNYVNGNIAHYQVTKKETTDSKGQTIRNTFKYPHDYLGTADYTAMVAANITGNMIDAKAEIVKTSPAPNIQLSENKINYTNSGNNNYTVASIQKSVKGNALEVEGTISQYDSKGNILEFTGKNGIVSSIIWGYDYQYPVAKITGADYNSAVAQLSVSMTALQSMDGSALLSELHRVRTGIPAAHVTTYTYKPLTGVTSITDPNNKINTYSYDGFKQLLSIKDQDGNLVKQNEYVYAVPDPNATLPVYFNAPQTGGIACTSCATGYTGNTVVYSIPFGKYHSFISQADADAMATTDYNTLGQLYANINATCTNTGNCNSFGYKFVNCACEPGQKICDGSVPDPNNAGWYINTYHHQWSDGSTSPTFTENIPPCTGTDKKKIGCNCETGTRVCESTTNNGGGSYTLQYHYQFSDNTNSATVTETITCSGVNKKLINCNCETAVKIYTGSTECGKSSDNGCCPGKWLCTFRYHWSDGSNYYGSECSDTPCTPE